MIRLSLTSIVVLSFTIGCGPKAGDSLCAQVPAPAACMTACDPTPGSPNTCPGGYHCSPDGKCDAECTQSGGQCGNGYNCTSDGSCVGGVGSDVGGADANCPDVHFAAMPSTPSVELVLDRSGSMTTNFGGMSRYEALEAGLFGASGAVTTAQANVYFGEELFAGDQMPCSDGPPGMLGVIGFSQPRALNNEAMLATLTMNQPPNGGSTPTSAALDTAVADFAANPPPAGSPPVILLATDGDPNSCDNGGDNGRSVNSTKAAYTAGIRLFIIGLAGLNTTFLQDMANAGAGVATGGTNAPYYTANNPASLAAAFNTIIGGVLSCNLMLSGQIDPATAMNGTVTLDGMTLVYGTDWTVDASGTTLQLLGAACTTLKTAANPAVDATFPCGSVIF